MVYGADADSAEAAIHMWRESPLNLDTHGYLYWLGGIDTKGAVDKVWAQYKTERRMALMAALLAVQHGNKDALAEIVKWTKFGITEYAVSANSLAPGGPARALRMFTEASGNENELCKWYDQNEARIQWDDVDKRFVKR